ncbi:MAG: hypothetical protein NC937_01195 [Candidatus Omnitrophica bacterium]|nr:hypothetical protein [Candidatus Omnitrophota bacterium]
MRRLFISFQNSSILFNRNRVTGTPIEKCNIENLKKMLNKGCWIKNLCSHLPELHYFKFFQYPESIFPGLSVIRAKSRSIDMDETCSYFLADFMTLDGTKIVDTAKISKDETKLLTEEILKTFDHFNYTVVGPGQILAWFPGRYPYRNWKFPTQLINHDYKQYLPQEGTLRTLVRIIENSWRLLEKHPVNRVRIDLGENPANFLWFHSQNKNVQKIQSLSERLGVNTLFWSNNNKLQDIAYFLGFNIVSQMPVNIEENSIVWINLEPQTCDLIGAIHTCELIDREIIGKFGGEAERLVIEFNSSFYRAFGVSLNFLYPAEKMSALKKILLARKTAGNFLVENG